MRKYLDLVFPSVYSLICLVATLFFHFQGNTNATNLFGMFFILGLLIFCLLLGHIVGTSKAEAEAKAREETAPTPPAPETKPEPAQPEKKPVEEAKAPPADTPTKPEDLVQSIVIALKPSNGKVLYCGDESIARRARVNDHSLIIITASVDVTNPNKNLPWSICSAKEPATIVKQVATNHEATQFTAANPEKGPFALTAEIPWCVL